MKRTPKDYLAIIIAGSNALKLSFKAAPKLTTIYTVNEVIARIIPVIQIWLGKNIIDEVVLHISNPIAQYTNLYIYLGIYFLLSISSDLLVTISFLTHERLNKVLSRFAHLSLVEHSLELDMSYFEDSAFYNSYSKVKNVIEFRLGQGAIAAVSLLGFAVEFVAVSFLLLSIHWILIPLIFILNLPVFIWGMGFSMITHDLESSLVEEGRKASYLADLATNKSSLYEVKVFNLKSYLVERYKNYFTILMDGSWKLAKSQFIGAFFTSAIIDVAYFLFWIWAIMQTIASRLTLGQLTLYVQAFNRGSWALRGMLRYINELFENGLYINDFYDFLKIKPKLVDKPGALGLKKITSIAFDHVWFKYKEDSPYVLKDISFIISPNENIALVGQNGSGKTTLIKLLMRFFDVEQGRILINDIDIKEYRIKDLWQNIGTVFQDFQQYQLSAKENIGFGQVEELEDDKKIEAAAKKAGADVFIEKFSEKYNATLGTRFNNGHELSVGQWQKVAIARTFMRDSSVMILDEPTASIDAKAEYEIFKQFVELVEGKITILISHKFSTVRLANKILVLENGEIIEYGTHKELLEQNGKYSEMFNLQAEGYK